MAGIGFELRKMLAKRTFMGELGALFYAALISSGPWLASILCLSLLSVYASMQLGRAEAELFRTLAVYSYGASLVLVGGVQLVITRYLADEHFLGRHGSTMPCFSTVAIGVMSVALAVSSAAYATLDVSLAFAFWGVSMFLSICMVWVSMVFIGAIKDYRAVVTAFLGGAAVALCGSVGLGKYYGGAGYMAGFALGQFAIFAALVSRMLTEFDLPGVWNRTVPGQFVKYWDMALTGLFYNAAIWMDKVVFWNTPESRTVLNWLRVNDLYESPVFFSYLTIVPAMAIFLLRVETAFHENYQQYYALVTGRGTLSQILARKVLLVESLRVNLRYLFVVQGTVTGLCLALAPTLVEKMELFPVQVTIFRLALVGAFLQALVSVVMVILFYFARRMSVLLTSAVYLLSMTVLSWLSADLGYQYYGYGYAGANLITLCVAYQLMEGCLSKLEYVTFSQEAV